MYRLILVTIMLLALPTMAHATCDGVDNCLGIYFDQGQWTQTCREVSPWEPFHVYFVLQNCTFGAIGGMEFAWRFAPTPAQLPIVLAADLPGLEPWLSDYYNVIYGVGQPIIIDGPFILMDLTLLVGTPFTADLQLGPSTPASLPGHAAINDWYDPANVVPLSFGAPVDADGWTVSGVAKLGDCAVPGEGVDWGTIKALFR
jgi:hypothetical protein